MKGLDGPTFFSIIVTACLLPVGFAETLETHSILMLADPASSC